MITVTETSTRQLTSPDEIAAFLEQRFAQMVETSPFKPGEAVHLASRAGLPSDLGVGDVGLMLLDVPGAWSHVMLLTANGAPIVVQVASGNLAKRAIPEAVGE